MTIEIDGKLFVDAGEGQPMVRIYPISDCGFFVICHDEAEAAALAQQWGTHQYGVRVVRRNHASSEQSWEKIQNISGHGKAIISSLIGNDNFNYLSKEILSELLSDLESKFIEISREAEKHFQ